MSYCENCGSQLAPNLKFCTNCGATLNPTATNTSPQFGPSPQYYMPPPVSMPPPPPPPPIDAYQMQPQPQQTPQSYGSESVVGALVLRRPKSLGRWDTWTGVLTSRRIIFAQMTPEMINAAVQQSREQAKADGKGFWGQWGDQLRATLGYSQRYLSMQPDAIAAETPGNFWLSNDLMCEVRVKLHWLDREHTRRELKVEFHSSAGTYEFHMDEDSDLIDLLKQVYGNRVNLPFGYFSKTVHIKF